VFVWEMITASANGIDLIPIKKNGDEIAKAVP